MRLSSHRTSLRRGAARRLASSSFALGSIACSGPQSALETAGIEAERVARLFWWMTAGSLVIWTLVVGLAIYAAFAAPRPGSEKLGRALIVGGGVIVPTIVLAVLLIGGLSMLPDFLARTPDPALRVVVSGEQWWWRVQYLPRDGAAVDLANEIRLPVGEPVEFELESPDVIHSFWIPALGGKMDMIPGRKTRLRLRPTRVGEFRGACAEYCGSSHALMAFPVVVQPRAEFEAWLAAQGTPAAEPSGEDVRSGAAVFIESGCGACHRVRGTSADGGVGPDLTHVGGRLSLGAGTLPNDVAAFRQWLTRTDRIKPGVHMPAFGMLEAAESRVLAVYMESLK